MIMLTNKVKIEYHWNNIDEDFDIFKVVKTKKEDFEKNILDSAIYTFKVEAVQWKFGATAFVLFKKNAVTEQEFKQSLLQEYPDIRIEKIDIFDETQRENNFYYENRLLAQLLFNSMRNFKSEEYQYHNLTGRLLYRIPKDKKDKGHVRFLEVILDPGMYLNMEHRTFRLNKKEKIMETGYVFDEKTGEFRKRLEEDEGKDVYIKGSLYHGHFHTDYFDIATYSKFAKSKLGMLEQFLCDVSENLSKYLSLEFVEREDVEEYAIKKNEKYEITNKDYCEKLQRKGVVIVDENNTEQSTKIVQWLQRDLVVLYGVEAEIGQLKKDRYNIRIVHSKEYYEEKKIEDIHSLAKTEYKDYLIQHVVEESEAIKEKENKDPVKVIVQELMIKEDIKNKKISIYHWEQLDYKKTWNFVTRKKINSSNSTAKKEKTTPDFEYVQLSIDPSGNIEFKTFTHFGEQTEETEKICLCYDSVVNQYFGGGNVVEGLVYSDMDNVQAIILTKEKTLPNIIEIKRVLLSTDESTPVRKELLEIALSEFEPNYPQYIENIEEWKEKLQKCKPILTKKEVKKLLNMKTDAAALFNRFLHHEYDVWIYGEWRKKDFEEQYQIGSLFNMKYQFIEADYNGNPSFVYYVGKKGKELKSANACCIRNIVSLGEKIEYLELFPLMVVEFVRNGQYTVLPFPFKYMREYRNRLE